VGTAHVPAATREIRESAGREQTNTTTPSHHSPPADSTRTCGSGGLSTGCPQHNTPVVNRFGKTPKNFALPPTVAEEPRYSGQHKHDGYPIRQHNFDPQPEGLLSPALKHVKIGGLVSPRNPPSENHHRTSRSMVSFTEFLCREVRIKIRILRRR
jgi:hypothetical protein